jgi:hypothetical protein
VIRHPSRLSLSALASATRPDTLELGLEREARRHSAQVHADHQGDQPPVVSYFRGPNLILNHRAPRPAASINKMI